MTQMHARAMMLSKKKQAVPSNCSNCPTIIQMIQNLGAETEMNTRFVNISAPRAYQICPNS
jgi:hypothetical protein